MLGNLWNAIYDEILEILLPKQVEPTGFADNVADTIIVNSNKEAEILVQETVNSKIKICGLT